VHSKSRTTPRRSLSGYPDFQVGEEVIHEPVTSVNQTGQSTSLELTLRDDASPFMRILSREVWIGRGRDPHAPTYEAATSVQNRYTFHDPGEYFVRMGPDMNDPHFWLYCT
ncbi:hypothetical protein GOV09_04295, partial [Candidatus Woesearchaeota archaeon]|nr:hypothetical protein [Candidatus Woesearchaeota archaeon]